MFKNIFATMGPAMAERFEDLCQEMPAPPPPRLNMHRRKPSSMLIKLPRELRDNIFREFIYTIYEDRTTPEERRLSPKPLLRHLVGPTLATSPIRGIMQTNAQLRSEFGQELYRHAHEESTITASAAADHGPPPANANNNVHLPGPTIQLLLPPHPIAPNIAVLLAAAQQARREYHLLRAAWNPAAIMPGIPRYLAQHLRSFSFTLAVPEAPARRDPFVYTGTHSNNVYATITFVGVGDGYYRDWNVLHDDFDVAVNSILAALPVLEELDVAMSLAPGGYNIRMPRGGREGKGGDDDGLCVKTGRVTGIEVPGMMVRREGEWKKNDKKNKKEGKEEKEEPTKESNDGLVRPRKKRKTGDSKAVSGHHECTCADAGAAAAAGGHKEAVQPVLVQPGSRLKRFKKSMVIRFAGLDDLQFTYSSQEDKFKHGRRVAVTRVQRSIDFFSEWSAAPRAELGAFFGVTSPTMLGITAPYRMPKQDVLPEMYERWKRHDGQLTRDRVKVLMGEWLENMEEHEAALKEAIMQEIALADQA